MNFTPALKESISFGAEEATRMGSSSIHSSHLLLGMIRQHDNSAIGLLEDKLRVSIVDLAQSTERAFKANPSAPLAEAKRSPRLFRRTLQTIFQMIDAPPNGSILLDEGAQQAVRGSVAEAKAKNSRVVDTQHLLLSLVRDEQSDMAVVFQQFGIGYSKLWELA
jgi:ATP-dependent Clp protease ATP-binding subunit ClpC